jgi:hypothetical protein
MLARTKEEFRKRIGRRKRSIEKGWLVGKSTIGKD